MIIKIVSKVKMKLGKLKKLLELINKMPALKGQTLTQ